MKGSPEVNLAVHRCNDSCTHKMFCNLLGALWAGFSESQYKSNGFSAYKRPPKDQLIDLNT